MANRITNQVIGVLGAVSMTTFFFAATLIG